MSLTGLYDVWFFTIKPFTFHSLTCERPRSLSKSIWIGELPWQLLWSVADTLGWMSDVHGFHVAGVLGKKCVCFGKNTKRSNHVWPETSQCFRWASVFTPYKNCFPARAGKAMEATKAEGLLEMLQKCNANLEVVQKAPVEKHTQKTFFFCRGY